VNQWLGPSGLAYVLAAGGFLMWLWPRYRARSAWLLAGSAFVTLVFSSGMVAAALSAPLEYAYPSVHSAQQYPQVGTIVVLTGYAADDPEMPLTGRLNASSAHRVTMVMQLRRTCPACRVIVSGKNVTAKVMGEVLVELGLDPTRLQLEDRSTTTAQSAHNLREILNDETFFLVTSAGHMTRSIEAMSKVNLKPIAVPTDHQMPRRWSAAQLQPTPDSLRVSDLAVHEYLGRLWYRLRGDI
jgi:uncharacterized SAM-binding protein YcdF (DUF218 family)